MVSEECLQNFVAIEKDLADGIKAANLTAAHLDYFAPSRKGRADYVVPALERVLESLGDTEAEYPYGKEAVNAIIVGHSRTYHFEVTPEGFRTYRHSYRGHEIDSSQREGIIQELITSHTLPEELSLEELRSLQEQCHTLINRVLWAKRGEVPNLPSTALPPDRSWVLGEDYYPSHFAKPALCRLLK